MKRCKWAIGNELNEQYHDNEWGVPVHNDQKLFELLSLEIMQVGLSWLIVLKKRESFRKAFDNFDFNIIKNYDDKKIDSLMDNKDIVRNKSKIKAIINNANAMNDIINEYGSFNEYLWNFVNNETIVNDVPNEQSIPTSTALSTLISKDLKSKNFKFIGPITVYSFLQACGIIDDHLNYCFKKRNKQI